MIGCNKVTHECQVRTNPSLSTRQQRISVHLAGMCDPVTANQTFILRNLKYNTVELCMYLHANIVYCASYSISWKTMNLELLGVPLRLSGFWGISEILKLVHFSDLGLLGFA